MKQKCQVWGTMSTIPNFTNLSSFFNGERQTEISRVRNEHLEQVLILRPSDPT